VNSKQTSIAVVVPVMNCGKTLGRTFDSILRQTLQPERIIVVYDVSSDNTLAVVMSYCESHPSLFVLINGPGEGVGAARQAALSVVESEYVAFIDGDDWYLDTALENLFQSVSKTGAACGLVCKVHTDGKILKHEPSGIGEVVDYETLKSSNPIAMSSTMYQTSLIRRVGGFDGKLLWIEDYDFHLRIARVTDYHLLRNVTTFYTVYESTNIRRTYHYSKWSAIVWRKHGFVNTGAISNALKSFVLTTILIPANLVRRIRDKNRRVFRAEYIQILMGYLVGLAIGYPPRKEKKTLKKGAIAVV